MIYEVAAAVDYILSLIASPTPTPDAIAAFASTLKDLLEQRCHRCWNPDEPECGSAYRSVAWQLHPAGEGADADVLRAFRSVLQIDAEEGEVVDEAKVVHVAMRWLPVKFTMWIDPACVAVRRGMGPGVGSGQCDDGWQGGSSVHVVWASMVAHAAQPQVPQLTVSSLVTKPIDMRPTAAHRYPQTMFASATQQRHSRSPSSCSSSSSYHGLVRSASLSSTVSTDATSITDADSEGCPSLCSPASTPFSSHATPDSVHDTTITARADTTQRFGGVRLFHADDDDDDDDDDDEEGDETIDAGTTVLGLSVCKPVLAAAFAPRPKVEGNYTTHDNGNVGVLGGGVKLGASRTTRHAQQSHSSSKSVSYGATRYAARTAAGFASAPMPTIPLPQQMHGYAPHYLPNQCVGPQPRMLPYTSTLPAPYGLQHARFHYAQPHPAPVDSETDVEPSTTTTGGAGRRLRSRGRRSRGRGAGRAARRQAAAMRALQLTSTDELDELARATASEISRSCTPSAQSGTVYSSPASSPVKRPVADLSIQDFAQMQSYWAARVEPV